MRKTSAKIKAVRPFKRVSTYTPDPRFEKWKLPYSSLSIEIGCGVGLHPIQWSIQNPQQALVAIERTNKKFHSFQGRVTNHELKNLYPVYGDAQDWLPANIQENSVENIYLLYPNPYPKEKQANKRWYRSSFTYFLLSILKMGGKIHFATNESFLFKECLLYAKDHWHLEVFKQRTSLKENWVPRTHFEKKYLGRGLTCYDIIFRKTPESEK